MRSLIISLASPDALLWQWCVCMNVCLYIHVCAHAHLRTTAFFMLLTLEFCLELEFETHGKASAHCQPGASYCLAPLNSWSR